MTVGTPIFTPGLGITRVQTDAIDAEQAIALAVAAYLESLTFTVNVRQLGNPPGADQRFRFTQVFDEWPDADQELPYPCASVSAANVPFQAHSLAPTPLEETFGVYDVPGALAGTVLWKTSELDVELQVDVWTRDIASREAVLAELPGAFAPEEGTGRVMLTGTPAYWSLPVRVSMEGYKRIDEPEPVYSHERRALVNLRASIDVVDLRCATLLSIGYQLKLGTGPELAALDSV